MALFAESPRPYRARTGANRTPWMWSPSGRPRRGRRAGCGRRTVGLLAARPVADPATGTPALTIASGQRFLFRRRGPPRRGRQLLPPLHRDVIDTRPPVYGLPTRVLIADCAYVVQTARSSRARLDRLDAGAQSVGSGSRPRRRWTRRYPDKAKELPAPARDAAAVRIATRRSTTLCPTARCSSASCAPRSPPLIAAGLPPSHRPHRATAADVALNHPPPQARISRYGWGGTPPRLEKLRPHHAAR